jgi:hypothetical protein
VAGEAAPASGDAAAAPGAAAGAQAAKDGKDAQSTAADAAKKPAEPAKDQAYWGGRVKELQGSISRNESFAVAMQSRINALANDYANEGDGVRQRAIEADRVKAIDDLNRLKKEIEDNKKALADLQEEARRAGVPPGWLR